MLDRRTDQRIQRVKLAAGILTATSIVALFAATLLPTDSPARAHGAGTRRQVPALSYQQPDLSPLLARVAGNTLIRPSQTLAAVKDDGTATKLLAKLKLQGVTQLAGENVAYVQVDKEGTKSVRKGDRLLEFTVDSVEPGRVTLNLQGVVVTLGHS